MPPTFIRHFSPHDVPPGPGSGYEYLEEGLSEGYQLIDSPAEGPEGVAHPEDDTPGDWQGGVVDQPIEGDQEPGEEEQAHTLQRSIGYLATSAPEADLGEGCIRLPVNFDQDPPQDNGKNISAGSGSVSEQAEPKPPLAAAAGGHGGGDGEDSPGVSKENNILFIGGISEADETDLGQSVAQHTDHPLKLSIVITHPPLPSDHQTAEHTDQSASEQKVSGIHTAQLPLTHQENPFVPSNDGSLPFEAILAKARDLEGVAGKATVTGSLVTVPASDTDPGRELHYELDIGSVSDGTIVGYRGNETSPSLTVSISCIGSPDGIRAEVYPSLEAATFDFSRRSVTDIPLGTEQIVVGTFIRHFEALGCNVNHIHMSVPLTELHRHDPGDLRATARETTFGRLYTGLGFSIHGTRIGQDDDRQLVLHAIFSKPFK